MKITLLIFVLFLYSFGIVQSQTIQWRGTDRSGIYNEKGLLKSWPDGGPAMLWHFDELGKGFSSPIIVENKLYITGALAGKGYVFALDLNGKQLWKSEYGVEWDDSYPGTRTTPTYSDGKLYVHSAHGLAVCLNAADGKIIWTVDLQKNFGATIPRWGIAESPLVFDDKAIFTAGGDNVNVIALNKNDGKTLWTSKGKGDKSAYCSPYILNHKGKKMLITMTADNILSIDPATGNLFWSHQKTNKWSVHPNTPVYNDGMLYCVSGYGSGGIMLKLADDGNSVTEVWSNKSLDNQMGGVILLDGYIYGSGHNDVSWQCLDWKTGEQKYSSKEVSKGCIIAADGMLYAYGEKGEVALIKPNPQKFEIAGKIKIEMGAEQHWAHPVIDNGVLYIRHGNVLMAYKIK